MSFLKRLIFYGGAVLDLAKVLIFVVIILVVVHYFVGTIFIVSGESMLPALQDGQLVWSNKIAYLTGSPKRGDPVVVLYPGDPANKKYVKRIIGLPGEKIIIKDGKVFINSLDNRLDESYLAVGVETDPNNEWDLGSDEYFLMGDNRPNSNDSRFFGSVEKRFIFGRVTFILWPDFRSVI